VELIVKYIIKYHYSKLKKPKPKPKSKRDKQTSFTLQFAPSNFY